MTATFPAEYAAARAALRKAEQNTQPLPDELVAKLRAYDAERWAQVELEVEAIAATIPALKAAVKALEDRACWRCSGTGVYGGASGYRRNGVAYCFTCNGQGCHR